VDAELLVDGREDFGVDLVGPTRPDYRWQAKAGEGFAAAAFRVDREGGRVSCPEGRLGIGWAAAAGRGHNDVITVKFSATDCRACPSRQRRTQGQRRAITPRPRGPYEALEAARLGEGTEEFQRESAKRAGVEGTHSQGVRACGLRRSRSSGEAKAHVQYLATAAAINLLRTSNCLEDKPREQARTSAFAKLMAPRSAA
jgi:transposase